ncbi:hypothetical protein [Pararhizobium arenae]|uniref:hypothetical protein n=1 Tax=Pararhizobium arenae TaxID=1856850 RepID=UPI00094ADEC1|nr:hypothetical protein [Pararhizobium arenae]
MSNRIRTAEQSARREAAIAKEAILTTAADSTAPRNPVAKADHYKRHLADAHRNIGTLQLRIAELEVECEKLRRDAEYALGLCVTRTVAEEARVGAFHLAREKAALLFEAKGGVPTMASEAIRAIPDPKPKFTK